MFVACSIFTWLSANVFRIDYMFEISFGMFDGFFISYFFINGSFSGIENSCCLRGNIAGRERYPPKVLLGLKVYMGCSDGRLS